MQRNEKITKCTNFLIKKAFLIAQTTATVHFFKFLLNQKYNLFPHYLKTN